jgi:hypothetical protein
MLSWGMVALVLAAGGAGSATHTVEYAVEVRGDAEVHVRYVDGDDRLVTQEITASAWSRRVEVDSARTDEVRVLAAAAPTAPRAQALSCVIVVDGVERVRDSGVGAVECRVDLAGLQPSSSGRAPPLGGGAEPPGDGTAIGDVVLWSAGGLAVVLLGFVAVRWRSRAPETAAPGLEREPHVRLMGVAGAITLLIAVGGFFVACAAEPAVPPSFDLERELGER